MPELDELLSFLENQIDTCHTHWQNVIKNLQNKFAPLLEGIGGTDPESGMCSTLLEYLVTGETTEQLVQFISKEIYDCKILPKLDDVF